MSIKVASLVEDDLNALLTVDDTDYVITFRCANASIIQASEIKKLRTGIAIEVGKGALLSLWPSKFLIEQNISLFPSPFIIDNSHKGEISLPLHNCGKNQVNLNHGQILAEGYLTKLTKVTLDSLEFSKEKVIVKSSRSLRKDKEIKFEVK